MASVEPDWTRETPRCFWDPSRKLLSSIRMYQKYKKRRGFISTILSKYCVIKHRFWSVITGADIPLNCQLGGGLLIPHPNGVVIHPDAVIGVNCLLYQQVTIGVKRYSTTPPIIGDHVDIGAGAKIIGPIRLEHNVVVGANSVVTRDVESNVIIGGIPARVISITTDKT